MSHLRNIIEGLDSPSKRALFRGLLGKIEHLETLISRNYVQENAALRQALRAYMDEDCCKCSPAGECMHCVATDAMMERILR
jgi:hypothetical protein